MFYYNKMLYLHTTVFVQKYLHYQYGMGRGFVVQQESTALYSKFWPHPENELQQSSDNLNVESTVCPSGTNSL
jgi:hypothetical protein